MARAFSKIRKTRNTPTNRYIYAIRVVDLFPCRCSTDFLAVAARFSLSRTVTLSKPSHTEARCLLRSPPRPSARCGGSFSKDNSIDLAAASQAIGLSDIISGAQIRAARILLGWSQAQLSRRCDVSQSSISKIEGDLLELKESTREKITGALAAARIDFIDSVGVTLRKENLRIEA